MPSENKNQSPGSDDKLFNQIYKTGNIPDDKLKSVFSPLPINQTQDNVVMLLRYYLKSFIKNYLIHVRWILDKTSLGSREEWA